MDMPGLAQPGEPTCCFCIPFRLAIILIGLLLWMDISKFVGFTVGMQEVSVPAFVAGAVALGVSALAGLLVLRYLYGRCTSERGPDGKRGMVVACALMIFANVV